MPANLH